jgi:uncharacterized protein
MELRGKRALVTGASGGLGRAIAEALAGEGAVLVLSGRREQELRALAESLPGGAERHDVVTADLSEEGAGEKLVQEAGDLDVLVANAGLPGTGRIEDEPKSELTTTLQVNLETPMLMAREVIPQLVEKGAGQIVFIGSLNGKAATPFTSVYCATKFGLRGFALALREDLHPRGVGVSHVMPGFIRGAGMFADSGATAPPYLGTTPVGEVGEAVVSAIRHDRAEVEPATVRLRIATGIAHRHPELAARVQRRGGADEIARSLHEGHLRKRSY